MTGPHGSTPFVFNEQRSLLDQFVGQLPGTVDELHISAPYYDREANALAEVLKRIQPKQLHLYFGLDTNVHGPSLANVVSGANCEVQLRRFDPPTFVHSKLVGAVSGRQGLLLCGSPNLSRAALTLTYTGGARGNCEVGLIRQGTADQIRAPFLASGLDLVDVPTGELQMLAFESDDPVDDPPAVALRRATWRRDGRVSVTAEPSPKAGQHLAWVGGAAKLDLGVTVDVLAEQSYPPLLVWLTNDDAAISNAAAIDDPNALERSLASRDTARDRPHETAGAGCRDAARALDELVASAMHL